MTTRIKIRGSNQDNRERLLSYNRKQINRLEYKIKRHKIKIEQYQKKMRDNKGEYFLHKKMKEKINKERQKILSLNQKRKFFLEKYWQIRDK